MDNYSFIRQSELEIASKVNLLSKRIRSQEQEVAVDFSHMTLEDELSEEEDHKDSSREAFGSSLENHKLSRKQRTHIRAINVKRKRDFVCLEKVNGELVNILEGLELHTEVFNAAEQRRIVDKVCELQEKVQKGELKRAFTAQGKGRSTIQFGCCFNYRTSKTGNLAGILKHETVDPLPHLFKVIAYLLISTITTSSARSVLFLSLVNAIFSSDQTLKLRKPVNIRVVHIHYRFLLDQCLC
ncbi:2-oxoglutarate (2OG) and Fe(II)-dependent oxygenase superfamily protein [Arabidopsis thaliana]|uniref:2-oxoglutarate (2OG) and Fe(II)-dependent oxygenase superfamily protein n=1 Tax=Arabidopsis thaliana TaxID=3702 RepID=B3H7C3_ARATH|nr:2-oxoglutarate (2OG) and Fe(II)-dependent oxygenase superfamily protein [Arabidopsis thaliana]AEE32377.1 2-oxoglutarate (2OG) and Fe(II)-dependent oxygenase superfamily protein [Arabidopsis thaliana]|eukprot:NP_001117456.1 2-oxoglutarate (2OG) and Fe(II)-dependent oxygenase superfamily protein [Arabidopsis thaliana]